MKYAVGLAFAVGYALTAARMMEHGAEYFLLLVVDLLAAEYLFSRLRRQPLVAALPMWFLLWIFLLGYAFKLFTGLILAGTQSGSEVLPSSYLECFLDTTAVIKALRSYTLGFLAFAAVACFVSKWGISSVERRGEGGTQYREGATQYYRDVVGAMFLSGIGVMVFTGYLMYSTGVGVMGMTAVALPYRLAGIVYYGRLVVVPGIFITLVVWSDIAGRKKLGVLAGLVLVIHGVSEAVLSTSKFTLIFMIVMITLVKLMLHGRLSMTLKYALCSLGIAYAFVYPVVAQYRNYRMTVKSDLLLPWSLALGDVTGKYTVGEWLGVGTAAAFWRVPGIDIVTAIIETDPVVGVSVAGMPQGAIDYVSHDVFGQPEGGNSAMAPSLIGAMYLYGGDVLVVFGTAAFALAVALAWKLLGSRRLSGRLRSSVVLRVLFFLPVYTLAGEGMFDGLLTMWRWLAAFALTAIICEVGWRTALSKGHVMKAVTGPRWLAGHCKSDGFKGPRVICAGVGREL
jgi:hypothetical protein